MPTIEEHDGASAVVAAELSYGQREQPKKMPNTVVDNKQQAERVTLNGQQENEERWIEFNIISGSNQIRFPIALLSLHFCLIRGVFCRLCDQFLQDSINNILGC